MADGVSGASLAAVSRVEAKRSATAVAFSLLATGAAIFGAGAALASPSSVNPGDGLLAFHVG